jgi:hypothetical protein
MDLRDVHEFKNDIFVCTNIENTLMEEFAKQRNISYWENGVDNSGKFCEVAHKSADYGITYKGRKIGLDVKASPYNIATFKVYDLEHLMFSRNLMWLVFINTGMKKEITRPNPSTECFLLGKHDVEYIYEHGDYKEEGHFMVNGIPNGKPTVRLYRNTIGRYFKVKKLYDLQISGRETKS